MIWGEYFCLDVVECLYFDLCVVGFVVFFVVEKYLGNDKLVVVLVWDGLCMGKYEFLLNDCELICGVVLVDVVLCVVLVNSFWLEIFEE